MTDSLEARVIAALARIRNPRLDGDILSTGMVRDLTVTPAGAVSFTFLLSREDPATLVREALGGHIYEWFLRNKRSEWRDYQRVVTQFELDRYLPVW